MKKKILNDLNLKQNICFNQVIERENTLYFTKSQTKVSSTIEIREICNMQKILAKYQKKSKITISLDKVIIEI